jgi:hypothetical protein
MVLSVIERTLSWILGNLDRGFYILGFGRQGLLFFEDGYGDLEESMRLVQFRGA